ncbi:MAG: response regulator [Gemmatimonadetes bacterium]|nr:response regulator [Gemmatimonadota bacterium]NIR80478.1 response regulator [Gemmatimonadota bacterium]NIT89239.1 response regulator [Gemmatimonadota bacterium]NIU33038.1 response regulator [Gemmatimonadota bacterium]NIU37419.1 response regulator [Gemmatimonadota bacterium]
MRGERGDGDRFEVEIQGIRVEIDGRPAVIGSVQDRTEQKRLTEGLVRAQRMEAVGRLSRVVAGDFNDILTGIIGHCDLALASLDDAAEERPDLEGVRRQAAKGVGQIRKLLAYSRQQVVRPRLLHPNRAIRNVSGMIDRLIGEGISVRSELSDFAEVVRIDPGQLELVVVNLVANARDAIGDDGVISIATESVDLTEEEVAHFPFEMPPGRYVELSVTDDGVGMSPETLERIFEPFFTTKDEGEGTGLGLSTVYGIVKQSDGFVHAESVEGIGSTLRVFFPARRAAPGKPAGSPAESYGEEVTGGGGEWILLVEDDEAVREATARALQTWGYRVRRAADGGEALALVEEGAEAKLVLAGVVLPDMEGEVFVERVRARHPGAQFLFMSGFSDPRSSLEKIAADPRRVIEKPFSPRELAARVEELLEGAREARAAEAR